LRVILSVLFVRLVALYREICAYLYNISKSVQNKKKISRQDVGLIYLEHLSLRTSQLDCQLSWIRRTLAWKVRILRHWKMFFSSKEKITRRVVTFGNVLVIRSIFTVTRFAW